MACRELKLIADQTNRKKYNNNQQQTSKSGLFKSAFFALLAVLYLDICTCDQTSQVQLFQRLRDTLPRRGVATSCAWEHVRPKEPGEPPSPRWAPKLDVCTPLHTFQNLHETDCYRQLPANISQLDSIQFVRVALACSEAAGAPPSWFFFRGSTSRGRGRLQTRLGPGPHAGPAGGSQQDNTPSTPPKAFRLENINTVPSSRLKLTGSNQSNGKPLGKPAPGQTHTHTHPAKLRVKGGPNTPHQRR